MANEMSKDEEAAFAAMRDQTIVAQQAEPEPEEVESEGGEAEGPDAGERAADDGQGRTERPKFVPHAALHEERTRRQALEAENRKLAEERARFDERLQTVLRMQQAQREEPKPEQLPAADDYVGRLEYAERELAKLRAGGEQQTEAQQEERRQQAQVEHLFSAASEDARQFKAKTPDYGEAYEFWKANRAEELAAYGIPAAQIPNVIGQEELSIAHGAFQRGASPAETLYRVAKHRGWKGKAATNGNGADDGAAEQIERVATGQQRSATLSGTGGGAAPTEMTASKLLAMSNEEFDAWTTKNPAKARRLMGEEPRRKGS